MTNPVISSEMGSRVTGDIGSPRNQRASKFIKHEPYEGF
jgi:hypothetical protein